MKPAPLRSPTHGADHAPLPAGSARQKAGSAGRPSRSGLGAWGGQFGAHWDRDRRDTILIVGAVLLTVAPQFAWLPIWCTGTFLLLLLWRLGLALSGRALPGIVWRWFGAIAIVGGVWLHEGTLIGRDAGVMLLVLFLGLKLLELHARRDAFVVIFLCCFLLLTGFFQSQGLWMAGASLVALTTLVASMVTMQLQHEDLSIALRLRHAAILLLQALPLAAILFLVFPRPSTPLWGQSGGGASSTGLSESMAPGDVSSLALSDGIAARVRFEGTPPVVQDMYWRGPTFTQFDGRSWHPSAVRRSITPEPTWAGDDPSRLVHYTMTLEPAPHRWLLGLDTPVSIPKMDGNPIDMMSTLELESREVLGQRARYEGISRPGLLLQGDDPPRAQDATRQLPRDFNPRTLALAEQWRASGARPEQLVDRALALFNQGGFNYTLEPQALGRHSVDEFLFSTKAGFCEHYASAFAVLMRAAGIPARVVTGYQGAEPNPSDAYWIIRQGDAHAWNEVWLDGQGWVRVDPTAAVAPDRIERGSQASTRGSATAGQAGGTAGEWLRAVRFMFDGMTHQWNQWVLGFNRDRQSSLFASVGLDIADWRVVASVLGGVLVLVVGTLILLSVRQNEPRHPLDQAFADFRVRLATVGGDRLPHETPNAWLARVEGLIEPASIRSARAIVETYNHMRYDLDTDHKDHVARLRQMIRSFQP